jgi:hypothetical protein
MVTLPSLDGHDAAGLDWTVSQAKNGFPAEPKIIATTIRPILHACEYHSS